MRLRPALLMPALALGILACSPPEPQPSLVVGPGADRLAFDYRTFHAPTSPIGPGVHGAARIHLGVRPDGSVASAERIDGSGAIWRYIQVAVYTMRFTPAEATDRGPWDVTVAVVIDPPRHGRAQELTLPREVEFTTAFHMQILEVKSGTLQP